MGVCSSQQIQSQTRSRRGSFSHSQHRNRETSYSKLANRNQTNLHAKQESRILQEIFKEFDKDNDNYLNAVEIQHFLEHLVKKSKKTIKIDENFMGRFLSSVGVMDDAKISKQEFIDSFRRL